MQDFYKLKVWRRSHDLSCTIRRLSRTIPGQHRFKMADQMYRAASSVPTNIVEGANRNTRREFARFLEIAAGSAAELEYHLLCLGEAELISPAELEPLMDEVVVIRKMLNAFIKRLRSYK